MLKVVNVPYVATVGKIYCNLRPTILVKQSQGKLKKPLGMIKAPCWYCNFGVEVYDAENKLIYSVESCCCRTMFWVDLPCSFCQTCSFTVYDVNRKV